MKKLKIKLILGFRQDQEHSIDANEAHKAYYLFLNPQERGIFNNGLAVNGSDIKSIVPDYQGSMGWNPNHLLNEDDMVEIRKEGVDSALRKMMASAKDIAQVCSSAQLSLPLENLIEEKGRTLVSGAVSSLAQSKSIR